jgi:hypothetical protein
LDEAHWGASVIRSETSKRQNRHDECAQALIDGRVALP